VRARRVMLLVGLVFAALPAGSAVAANALIGQVGGGSNFVCLGRGVWADTNYVVPSGGGTITTFFYASIPANAGQQIDFLILRPTGRGNYTVVGKTGLVTLAGGPQGGFSANIAVQGGDILGFWPAANLAGCAHSGSGVIASTLTFSVPDPAFGATIIGLLNTRSGTDLNELARLVTPLTSKSPCMRRGRQNFSGEFKNHGDCVSFIASGGKNHPSDSEKPRGHTALKRPRLRGSLHRSGSRR
jgi:hypothetical protein